MAVPASQAVSSSPVNPVQESETAEPTPPKSHQANKMLITIITQDRGRSFFIIPPKDFPIVAFNPEKLVPKPNFFELYLSLFWGSSIVPTLQIFRVGGDSGSETQPRLASISPLTLTLVTFALSNEK
jgi:hypothetical protein